MFGCWLLGLVLTIDMLCAGAAAGNYTCANQIVQAPLSLGSLSTSGASISGCTFRGLVTLTDPMLTNATINITRSRFEAGFTATSTVWSNVTLVITESIMLANPSSGFVMVFAQLIRQEACVLRLRASSLLALPPTSTNMPYEALRFNNVWTASTIELYDTNVTAAGPSTQVRTCYLGGLVNSTLRITNSHCVARSTSASSERVSALIVGGLIQSSIVMSNSSVVAAALLYESGRILAGSLGDLHNASSLVIEHGCTIVASYTGMAGELEEMEATAIHFGGAVRDSSITVSNSTLQAYGPFATSALRTLTDMTNVSVFLHQTMFAVTAAQYGSVCFFAYGGMKDVSATLADVSFVNCGSTIAPSASQALSMRYLLRCNSFDGDTTTAIQQQYLLGQSATYTLVPCGQCQAVLDCNAENTLYVSAQQAPFHCVCTCNFDRLPEPRRQWQFNSRCDLLSRPTYNPIPSRSATRSRNTPSRSGSPSPTASHNTVTPSKSRPLRTITPSVSLGTPTPTSSLPRSRSLSLSRARSVSPTPSLELLALLPVASKSSLESDDVTQSANGTLGRNGPIVVVSFVPPAGFSQPTARMPQLLRPSGACSTAFEPAVETEGPAPLDPQDLTEAQLQLAAVLCSNLTFAVVPGAALAIAFELPRIFASYEVAHRILTLPSTAGVGGTSQAVSLRLVLTLSWQPNDFYPVVHMLNRSVELEIDLSRALGASPPAPPTQVPTRSSTVLDIIAFACVVVLACLGEFSSALTLYRHRLMLFHRYWGGSSDSSVPPVYHGPRPFPDNVILDSTLSTTGDAAAAADDYDNAAVAYNLSLMIACAVVVAIVAFARWKIRGGSRRPTTNAIEGLDDDMEQQATPPLLSPGAGPGGSSSSVANSPLAVHGWLAAAVVFAQPAWGAGCLLLVGGVASEAQLFGAVAVIIAACLPVAVITLAFGRAPFGKRMRFVVTDPTCASPSASAVERFASWLIARNGAWHQQVADRDDEKEVAARAEYEAFYRPLWRPFTGGRHWYLAVDFFLTATTAVGSAIADRTEVPIAGGVVCLVVNAGGLAGVAFLRPYHRRYAFISAAVAHALVALQSACFAVACAAATAAADAVLLGAGGLVEAVAIILTVGSILVAWKLARTDERVNDLDLDRRAARLHNASTRTRPTAVTSSGASGSGFEMDVERDDEPPRTPPAAGKAATRRRAITTSSVSQLSAARLSAVQEPAVPSARESEPTSGDYDDL
jgi:hypothetical protein